MTYYQTSSFYAKVIKQKFDRLPYQYPQQGHQEYEDHEYIRSLAYENGDMTYLTNMSNCRLKYKGALPRRNDSVNKSRKTDGHGAIINNKDDSSES